MYSLAGQAEAAKHKLKKFMNRDFYLLHREWPYKNVPHRVIAEKYMVDESGTQLKDYKFFCFDGEPNSFKDLLEIGGNLVTIIMPVGGLIG